MTEDVNIYFGEATKYRFNSDFDLMSPTTLLIHVFTDKSGDINITHIKFFQRRPVIVM